MSRLDVPTFTNGGLLILVLVVLSLAVLAVLTWRGEP